jgi:hypothetical protein
LDERKIALATIMLHHPEPEGTGAAKREGELGLGRRVTCSPFFGRRSACSGVRRTTWCADPPYPWATIGSAERPLVGIGDARTGGAIALIPPLATR